MWKGTNQRQKGIAVITVFAVLAWVAISLIGFDTSAATGALVDCPNAPLRADLTGTASGGGRAPSGMAMFRERGSNALMINVRNINTTAEITLNVMIGGTNVGTINVGRNGNGQLRLDSATGINEGTTITLMNGGTTVLSGTFACVGGGGNTNGNPNGNTNTNINTNTNSNTNTNTNMNSNTNTNINTNANTNMNTSPTPRS